VSHSKITTHHQALQQTSQHEATNLTFNQGLLH
jgi:hypothetical protein